MISPDALPWRKAAASTANGNCVELAPTPDGVAMRDSKDPDGPILRLTREGMAALLASAKAGELDELAREGR